jgi:hypothetical protein
MLLFLFLLVVVVVAGDAGPVVDLSACSFFSISDILLLELNTLCPCLDDFGLLVVAEYRDKEGSPIEPTPSILLLKYRLGRKPPVLSSFAFKEEVTFAAAGGDEFSPATACGIMGRCGFRRANG